MSHLREQIIEAAVAAIAAGGGPVGLTVGRSTDASVHVADLPHVAVYGADEDVVEHEFGTGVEREVVLGTEARARRPEAGNIDETLEPIETWITKQLTTDATFLALLDKVEETTFTPDRSEEGEGVGSATQNFEVRYHTQKIDPEAAA